MAVAIVTPNHVHYPAAREFLKRGIHVICDKPLSNNLEDAKALRDNSISDNHVSPATGTGEQLELCAESLEEANAIMAREVGGWLKDPAVFASTLDGIRFYDAEGNLLNVVAGSVSEADLRANLQQLYGVDASA